MIFDDLTNDTIAVTFYEAQENVLNTYRYYFILFYLFFVF